MNMRTWGEKTGCLVTKEPGKVRKIYMDWKSHGNLQFLDEKLEKI